MDGCQEPGKGHARQGARAHQALVAIAGRLTGDAREMITFQTAMLEDPALSEAAFASIASGMLADEAWMHALDAEIAGYKASQEDYFRARASDLVDIRDRVLRHLSGREATSIPAGAIVLADDLTPSMFLATDWRGGGIALRHGSPTSHVAMLSRANSVPMVGAVANGAEGVAPGMAAMLDRSVGRLVLAPGPQDRADFDRRRSAADARDRSAAAVIGQPALLANGERISVLLNIADPAEVAGVDPEICD